jgi:hypothetical protein
MEGDEAAAPSLQATIEVTSIDATTVELTQSLPGPTAHHCIAVLFGTRAAVVNKLTALQGILGPPL